MAETVIVNILDLIDSIGEEEVQTILSGFSCLKNKEIENFVRKNAVIFAKKKMSVTYLVFDRSGNLSSIFTLAHKALEINCRELSGTTRRKLERFSQYDKTGNSFTISAFLIAQFEKNDNYQGTDMPSGNELMDYTFGILAEVQHDIGGSLVYLECEDEKKLLDFYTGEPNLFRIFGERYSETDGVKYIQLLRFI